MKHAIAICNADPTDGPLAAAFGAAALISQTGDGRWTIAATLPPEGAAFIAGLFEPSKRQRLIDAGFSAEQVDAVLAGVSVTVAPGILTQEAIAAFVSNTLPPEQNVAESEQPQA